MVGLIVGAGANVGLVDVRRTRVVLLNHVLDVPHVDCVDIGKRKLEPGRQALHCTVLELRGFVVLADLARALFRVHLFRDISRERTSSALLFIFHAIIEILQTYTRVAAVRVARVGLGLVLRL